MSAVLPDPSRTHLNRELIQFPDGVQNRTEAIQHRLDIANLKRKIGKNQVRAIRALLTGSPEDMKRIQADIKNLTAEREQAEKELFRIRGEIKTGELKSEFVSASTKAVKRFGSSFDTKEVRQKEQEIKALTDENNDLKKEISDLNKHIQQMEKDHKEETDKLKGTLGKIYDLFPDIREKLFIEGLCRIIGFGKDMIKELLAMKPITFSGSLYSPEFKRHFDTQRSTAKVEPHPEQRGKLRLMIDGVSDSTWFRNKRMEFLQKIGIKQKQNQQEEHGKRKGMKQ